MSAPIESSQVPPAAAAAEDASPPTETAPPAAAAESRKRKAGEDGDVEETAADTQPSPKKVKPSPKGKGKKAAPAYATNMENSIVSQVNTVNKEAFRKSMQRIASHGRRAAHPYQSDEEDETTTEATPKSKVKPLAWMPGVQESIVNRITTKTEACLDRYAKLMEVMLPHIHNHGHSGGGCKCGPYQESAPQPEDQQGKESSQAQSAETEPQASAPETPQYIATDFDYPANLEGMTHDEAFARLRRYWTFHRTLDPRDYRSIWTTDSLEEADVFAAINCVTEAVSRVPGQELGLFTAEAWKNYYLPKVIPARPKAAEVDVKVARADQAVDDILIPFWISDSYLSGGFHGSPMHTLLIQFKKRLELMDTANFNTIIWDSAPKYFIRNQARWAEIIAEQARAIGIDTSAQRCAVLSRRYDDVAPADQMDNLSCGLHTVLNAWALALGGQPNKNFRATNAFYQEAAQMINLAFAGYLDSAMIFHWFAKNKFILTQRKEAETSKMIDILHSDAGIRRFKSTVPVTRSEILTFEHLRKALVKLQRGPNYEMRLSLGEDARPSDGQEQVQQIPEGFGSIQGSDLREHLGSFGHQTSRVNAIIALIANEEDRQAYGKLLRDGHVSRWQNLFNKKPFNRHLW